MTTQPDKPKRWRRWQFSLRTLMLIMFAVACFLGGWQANEWKRQRELDQAQRDADARRQAAQAAIDAMARTMTQPISSEDSE